MRHLLSSSNRPKLCLRLRFRLERALLLLRERNRAMVASRLHLLEGARGCEERRRPRRRCLPTPTRVRAAADAVTRRRARTIRSLWRWGHAATAVLGHRLLLLLGQEAPLRNVLLRHREDWYADLQRPLVCTNDLSVFMRCTYVWTLPNLVNDPD